MAHDHEDRRDGVSRRRAFECVLWAGTGVVWIVSDGLSDSLSFLGPADAATANAQTKLTIPIIVKDETSVYWRTVLAGARQAGRDLGVEVFELAVQSDSELSDQIGMLEKAVASNPAAIVIAPAQSATLDNLIDRAAEKVKIIGIDAAAGSSTMAARVTTDNVQAGRLAGDILADMIKRTYADTEGDVALITALPGVAELDQRARGFREHVAEKYGALDIVAHEIADGKAETGYKIMMSLIEGHPELRGVFASSLPMAQGAAEAVALHRTNKTGDIINLVGFGMDDKLVKLLQEGTVAALVVPDPFRLGYVGIKTALAAATGEKVSANIDIGTNVITKANMSSARSQELLKPKI